ncbi:GumC family protein [Thermoflavifilum thermophilum]|uniref:Uncharacterized protein involved in exopolysaccharide biosynthesis n=1 Tax=Thermoflavifilum thermophilum TaxID=1393122 RepID=A0A1I7NE61_9BACT|nr:Wzz/FepE/Etk N-terminal domain-containing protein [Thermoflavifilum thermophilum]SFV32967.1 Uncharacterized protein involved in exopolysaccharide biosynthesis [Thermoflavifilum thermophilum]
MDIVYFIRAVWKRKWLIIIIFLITLIAAYFFTLHEKKKYFSKAEIATGFTMNDQVRLGNDQGFDIYTINLKFDNIVKTFTSPQVISLLSYSLILHDLNPSQTVFRNPNEADLQQIFSQIPRSEAIKIFSEKLEQMKMLSSFDSTERKLIELLKTYGYDEESLLADIQVYRLEQTDYVDIDCTTENPLLSAFIANTLCKQFNRFYTSYLIQRSAENIQLLDTMIAQKKAFLDSQENRLNNVLRGGDAAIADANISLIQDYQTKLQQKQSDLNNAQIALKEVEKQIAQYDQLQKTIFENNTSIIQLNRQISDLQAQYDNNPSPDLANKIASLRRQLQDKLSENAQNSLSDLPPKATLIQKQSDLQVEIQSDQADIQNLQNSIRTLSANIRSSASRNVIIDALQKEVDRARADYLNAQDKYNNIINQGAKDAGFKQILIAQPAVNPLPSHRFIIMGLSGFTAVCFTIFLIVFIEYIDLSIKTPSFFVKQTGLPILSPINRVNLKKNKIWELLSQASPKSEKRQNTIRELIRKVRHQIEKSGNRIILFTSTEPQQGKTTLIQALAFSFSLSKKKVLMIDTNFCNNDLTVLTGAKPTLEQFSTQNIKISREELEQVVTHTSIPLVDVIGCEGGDYTPNEILPDGNLLEHLKDLLDWYDYIFLEAAPMNEYTDTKEMVEYVDGIIAVFSSEAIIKEDDQEGINYLKSLNGKFNGAILNKVEFENLDR